MLKLKLAILFLLSGVFAHGHGEDTLGPNGGHIRMPGAFHTELVVVGPTKFKIYLIDIDFKNPTTKDSKLSVRIEGDTISKVNCKSDKDFYLCDSSPTSIKTKAKLIVEATRMSQVGNSATYELPLK